MQTVVYFKEGEGRTGKGVISFIAREGGQRVVDVEDIVRVSPTPIKDRIL